MIRDHHLFDTRYVYIYNIYTEISSFNPPTDTRMYYVYFENSNLKEYLDPHHPSIYRYMLMKF